MRVVRISILIKVVIIGIITIRVNTRVVIRVASRVCLCGRG
jgi:hypothetical protein